MFYADIQAFLLSDDELDKESDEEEVLAVRDDMDEDPQDAKVRTPSPDLTQPEPCHVQESASDSSSPDLKKFNNTLPLTERQLIKYLRKMSRVLFNRITEKQSEQHKEAAVSYADLKASIDQHYDENIPHRDQTDKLVEASMSSLDRISTTISDLYKGLDVITQLLKDINNAVKDDPATNQKLNEATETFARISSNITEAFKGKPSSTPSGSVTPTLALTHIPTNVEGENATHTATEEPSSHTEGEAKDTTMAIPISSIHPTEVQPTHDQPITSVISHPESSHVTPRIDKGKGIATESNEDPSKRLVPASTIIRLDLDEPKATEEAKLLAMSRPEVIKVVQEEVDKIGLDPKKLQVPKQARSSKRLRMLSMKSSRESTLKRPEPITDVRIHPNIKPIIVSVFRNNDKRNFDVHQPFKFSDFGIIELDELGLIIQKKKNFVVKDLMTSLRKRYERLKKIPKELRIQSALPSQVPEQALS
ncbi:hypothetical protein Tco_0405462 [Tanacetum coccineum]